MKILLDTCCLIWIISDPEKLPALIASKLLARNSIIYISPISCGEIACLVNKNKIELDTHWKTWFNTNTEKNGWELIDIDLNVIQEAYSLPGEFHADPADRIITATARLNNLTLFTADTKMLDYPFVTTMWKT
jgi:PIN domain nuclease of toxin-antitoxin system